jgi:SRSO17 transposase
MPSSRSARPTIRFVDEYCQLFEDLFPEVRSYEAFKLLHLGMISEVKRKSLPAIAKAVGLDNQQSLHHFLRGAPSGWGSRDGGLRGVLQTRDQNAH